MLSMTTPDQFREQLQEALNRLYAPDYRPSEAFCRLVGADPLEGAFGVQSAIVRAIEEMEPAHDAPKGDYSRLIHDLLCCRYVQRLTQDETAQRLNISVAKAWRVQREAIHALGRYLWERSLAARPGDVAAEGESGAQVGEPDWRSQTERELASLDASAPNATASVEQALESVRELVSMLASGGRVPIRLEAIQPGLEARLHPSVLRQMLLTILKRLASCGGPGEISVFAGLEDGNVRIVLAAAVGSDREADDLCDALVGGLVKPETVAVRAEIEDRHVFVSMDLPSTDVSPILVVDDNPDIVDLYRRSVEGTRYSIVHVRKGQDLFDAVAATRPKAIVLDVMLPDDDGWSLLLRLYEHPLTCTIPVIVCSVVREEELALALGAAMYLPKPVRPSEFRQALDRVLAQASSGAPGETANTPTAC
jgi:CheY-like chemotaxis protein